MTDEKKEPTEHTPGPWARSKDDWWIYSRANGEMIVDDIATENEFDYWLIAAAPEMLAALINVRKLISEGALTGFNCHDGDWAERLFASQQVTSAAIKKAAP